MSIASRIQEIETHIGDVYDTINYSYDTTGINKNIINIPKYLKKGYIDIINNGIDTLYNNFPKVSGIGSNLSLTPTYEAPMKLNEIQGNTLQNGTPTPSSPVPIQSVTGLQNVTISNSDNTDSNTYEVNLGKNLLNVKDGSYSYGTTNTWIVQNHEVKMSVNDITYQGGNIKLTDGTTSRWADGVDNDIAPSGTYTLSVNKTGTITYDSDGFVVFYIKLYNNDGTVTTGTQLVIRDNQNKYTSTFTVDSGKHIGEVTIYSQYIQCQDVELKIQLERGYQATSYSPYFTPIELNKINTYQDSIKKSTGKNLFDKDNAIVLNAYFNLQQGIISNDNTRSIYIPCKPNTTYTMQKNGSARFRIGTTDSVPIIGSSILNINSDDSASVLTITTPSNAKYLIAYIYGTFDTNPKTFDEVLNTIMINEGSTALPYEPYGKVWYITKNIGKVVLNGSENWTNFTTVAGSSNTMSQIDLPMQFLNRDGYTDRFPVIPDYSATEHFVIAGGLTHLYVHILNSRLSTLDVAGFKSWLASNITTFYYVLKTPIYEVITNTTLIEQLETLYNAKSKNGTTNINVTSEDLSMILNVGVLKGE